MASDKSVKTPLRWLSKAQRECLQSDITSALHSMASEWKVRSEESGIVIDAAADRVAVAGNHYRVLVDSKAMLAINLELDALRYLLSLPVGVSADAYHEDGFMACLERDFLTELSRRLLSKVKFETLSVRRATSDVFFKGSKHRQHLFDIRTGGRAFGQIEFLSEAIEQMVARPVATSIKALLARRNAIVKEQVQLRATIGQVELPFVELRQIVVGDVLLLNESLASLVKLNTVSGRKVAEAMLGRNENRIALKISSLATADVVAKRSIQ